MLVLGSIRCTEQMLAITTTTWNNVGNRQQSSHTCNSFSDSLLWRHNDRDGGVSNHQPYYCLLNHPFRRRSKKTSKVGITSLCAGNSPGTSEYLAQITSGTENVSIWCRYHDPWRLVIAKNHVLVLPCLRTNMLTHDMWIPFCIIHINFIPWVVCMAIQVLYTIDTWYIAVVY